MRQLPFRDGGAGRTILCVHQGGELYGSDRSFLQAVEALRHRWPEAHIRILLAADGPLRERLAVHADEVVVRDLFVLRLATPFRMLFKSTVGLPWYLARARRDMARADLVYINTTVIADFMIAARGVRAITVLHAREIPKRRVMPVIHGLLRLSGAHVIFNSHATRAAFAPERAGDIVIHNGVKEVAGVAPATAPPGGYSPDRPLRIVMLGRINDWKGQDLLVGAVGRLSAQDRARVRIRIVGSTYGDTTAPLDALNDQIARAGLGDMVSIESFTDDPGGAYAWADLCAVPSRLPEPFGRVAIEAMAQGRGVLASGHGGLVEIVEHDRSGLLLPPGDEAAMARAIESLLNAPDRVAQLGAGALTRFRDRFTVEGMARALQSYIGALA